MPCSGCNDKPHPPRATRFAPRTIKVWLGKAYFEDAAKRSPAYNEAVLSRAEHVGVHGATVYIVERQWLDECRLRFPPTSNHNFPSGADPP
jgi:hypothetical protein